MQQRNILLLCRGRYPAAARKLENMLLAAQMPELAHRISVLNRGRTEDEPIVVQLEPGPRGSFMSRLSNGQLEPLAPRPPCGFNFMPLILAGPLDGVERSYTCPSCGTVANLTPPLFLEE